MTTGVKAQILKYDGLRVPRYTSYPTAPHFEPVSGQEQYEDWLAALDQDSALSLYIHVPFCPRMCHYCGCHTKVTRRYAPVEDYIHLLMREAAILARHINKSQKLAHIHFGGGSPTMIRADDFSRLIQTFRTLFTFDEQAEIAIEIDPRQLTEGRVAAYARSGVNRASLGVQDFDQKVMCAVNRAQPFHLSYDAVKMLRDYGINQINLDLMYGLPHQTLDSMRRSADYAALLQPDRIALFGYAHVPWMKKHMRLIDEEALPGSMVRYDMFEIAARELEQVHGYLPVGIDHFVKPGDTMALARQNGTLHRNFQGYTTDRCDALLGLGISSIGKLPQGFVQNSPDMPIYQDAILDSRLPVTKMKAVSAEDRLRAAVIERIMCDLAVDLGQTCITHGFTADYLDSDLTALEPFAADNIATIDFTARTVSIPMESRHAVRMICAAFDTNLREADTATKHAAAI
ncbi:MAG: oxygen-independent coproporphyrinogen III oxidase [Rhodospirillales bacterium]|nr:oxygen-independent coproporphyrinogen III oxidase [Rhodospirillales bacterium]